MKIRFAFAAAAVAALCAASAHAADSSAVVAQVRDRAARYGMETGQMKLAQTIRVSTPQGDMDQRATYYKKDAKFRIESTMKIPGSQVPDMKTVVIHDGAKTTLVPPFGPARVLSSTESAAYRRGDESWSFINESTKVTGEETVGGRPAHVLETTNERGQKVRIWADVETLQIVQGELAEGGDTFRWAFSDFRPVKGDFEMPYKTVVSVNDKPLSTVTVDSVELGTPVDDALFDPKKAEAERPAPQIPGF